MARENVYERGKAQLKIADEIRGYQRQWLAETRERVKRGESFAICNGDEFEEIFNIMDIPVVVINYYNFIIIVKGLGGYYSKILEEYGYEDGDWFAYGLATMLDNNPDKAPWGGLPKPAIIIGGSKQDVEMRVLEIWAQECGCTFFPLEFCMDPIPEKPIIRPGWYDRIYDHWDEFYDPVRLDLRVKEVEALIAHLEVTTGKTFSISKLNRSIELFNEQMEYWEKTDELLAYTRPCPVGWRDSQAVHQAKWHRGTAKGRDFLKAYYEEVKKRVDKGEGVVPEEKVRLLGFFSNPPRFSQYLADKYGTVFVGSSNSSAHCYRRKVLHNDPIRTLAARQMSFSFETPDVDMRNAEEQKIDGVIEEASIPHLSHRDICEEKDIPFLRVTRDVDDDENRAMLDKFMAEIISRKR